MDAAKMSSIEIRSKDVRMVPIGEIRLNNSNYNTHSDEQIDRLAKLIQYQGFRDPITISNRSGVCIAGEGRYLAAKKLGMTELPAIFQDFDSEDQEVSYGISHNAIHDWSELDLSKINTDIGSWDPGFDLELLGLKDFVLEPADKLEPQCDEDEVPEKVEPRTKLGDIYSLGQHRLMCGDSTSIDAVEKLMDGEKADVIFTDPPYGVNMTAKNELLNKHTGQASLTSGIANDDLSVDELKPIIQAVFANIWTILADKSCYYIASPQGGELGLMMMMMMQEAGIPCRHMIVWVKNAPVFSLGRLDYDYQHEPLLYGWPEKKTHHKSSFEGQWTKSTWFCDREPNKLHPTMKPVALPENALMNSTKPGMICADLFGGSGSTLIACEKTNRVSRTMEIDPRYCDVIVARWEQYTGKKAELLGSA